MSTPAQAVGIGWEGEAWPVLQAVYVIYARSLGTRVTQSAVNAELRREPEDPATDWAFYHLAEAGYVRSIGKAWQAQGPISCEPTEKALQLLAGWPATSAELALAQ